MNMPIGMLIQHAFTARDLGAEVLQFEPYWYFFDNGEPTEKFRMLQMALA